MAPMRILKFAVIACVYYAALVASYRFGDTLNRAYCSMCPNNIQHIACNHSGKFDAKCPSNARMVEMTPQLKERILKGHNILRNKVAGGTYRNFSGACRMATLHWGEELELLSELDVKKCTTDYDNCFRTRHYRYSGQNVGKQMVGAKSKDAHQTILNIIKGWMAYGSEVTADQLEFNTIPMKSLNSDTFSVMVVDESSRVGCAAATFFGPAKKGQDVLLSCRYSRSNIRNMPVYRKCATGAEASGCLSGHNARYNFLCSATEIVFPNEIQ